MCILDLFWVSNSLIGYILNAFENNLDMFLVLLAYFSVFTPKGFRWNKMGMQMR